VSTLALVVDADIEMNRRKVGHLAQEKEFTLIISEVDETESLAFIEGSRELIGAMEEANMTTTTVQRLLEESLAALNRFDYTRIRDLHDEIRDLHDAAFRYREKEDALTLAIADAKEDGYATASAEDLLALAAGLFAKEQYARAIETITRAEEALTLQMRLEDSNLWKRSIRFVADYWWAILLVSIALGTGGFFAEQKRKRIRAVRALKTLDEEEKHIRALMEELQKEYFVKKTTSAHLYANRQESYKKRLVDIEQERMKNREVAQELVLEQENLEVQREEILALIKKTQRDHYVDHITGKEDYARIYAAHKKQLIDVEKRIAMRKEEQSVREKKAS
jgi:hypothetical protein